MEPYGKPIQRSCKSAFIKIKVIARVNHGEDQME